MNEVLHVLAVIALGLLTARLIERVFEHSAFYHRWGRLLLLMALMAYVVLLLLMALMAYVVVRTPSPWQ